MPNTVYTPVILTATVDTTLDFGAIMGSLYVKNDGAGTAFLKLDGSPGASVQDGQFSLKEGQALALDQISFRTLGIASSGSIIVEAIAVPRGGGTSQGN
jgi:hypothetical protein